MAYYNVEPLRNPEEIIQMKSALYELGGDSNKFLFTLGINTGLRISGLVKLRVGDIFGKPYTDLLEKKTQKKRRLHLIAIQGDIVEYCVDKQPDDFLFQSKKTDSYISTT